MGGWLTSGTGRLPQVALLVLGAVAGSVSAQDLDTLIGRARGAATPEIRLEALGAIAHLQPPDGPPDAEVTRALAAGLEDPTPEVRRGTAALLGAGQHPDVAVRALVSAIDDARARWQKGWKELEDVAVLSSGELRKLDDLLERSPEEGQRWIDRFNARVTELRDGIAAAAGDRDALAPALALWPDDRAVAALVEVVAASRFEPEALAPVDALLQLASRKAFDAVVEELLRCEERRDELEAELRRLSRTKEREDDEDQLKVLEFREGRARIEHQDSCEYANELHSRLERFAKERGLPPPPGSRSSLRPWRSWRVEARPALPKNLGRVEVERAGDGG